MVRIVPSAAGADRRLHWRMATRAPDPRRLHVEAFARDGATLEGRLPLRAMPRLLGAAHPQAQPGEADAAAWRVRGEQRHVAGGEPQPWLHLEVQASMALECQRCLGPVETSLDVDRWFRFAHDEDEAAVLDAEVEEDVLALGRPLDLRELVEDELLLALPLVPRHERCPSPLPVAAPAEAEEAEAARPNPFAVLAALKRPPGGDA